MHLPLEVGVCSSLLVFSATILLPVALCELFLLRRIYRRNVIVSISDAILNPKLPRHVIRTDDFIQSSVRFSPWLLKMRSLPCETRNIKHFAPPPPPPPPTPDTRENGCASLPVVSRGNMLSAVAGFTVQFFKFISQSTKFLYSDWTTAVRFILSCALQNSN